MGAQHRVAHLSMRGLGMQRSCTSAVAAFKSVAEKGIWTLRLNKAHEFFSEGRMNEALFEFAQLAAVGIESAQVSCISFVFHAHETALLTYCE